VELNPDGLPKGWVREDVFRKIKTGVQNFPVNETKASLFQIKTISYIELAFLMVNPFIVQYYTDPVSHCTFRTLKSAIHYAETGEITKPHVCVLNQKIGVYDLYSFDKSADLVIFL
jgi:hypothetical protein